MKQYHDELLVNSVSILPVHVRGSSMHHKHKDTMFVEVVRTYEWMLAMIQNIFMCYKGGEEIVSLDLKTV